VLNLPEDLKEEVDELVSNRNYVTHRFLRDRATFMHDSGFSEHVAGAGEDPLQRRPPRPR
jgi:hypothetical protein